jgi:hypothetical protein
MGVITDAKERLVMVVAIQYDVVMTSRSYADLIAYGTLALARCFGLIVVAC